MNRSRRGLVRSRPGLHPRTWVGWRPNGAGLQKPKHYRAMWRTVVENRRALPWAWRILRKGVCDGCALGVSGFRDWTMHGVHLCTTRLELLKLNTATAIADDALSDAETLARTSGPRTLRELGQIGRAHV